MNSDQLRYFELAYQFQNFSAAARQVPCTPQGLAKAIHALEKELDVTLFENDPVTGLPHPTDYAHELYEYACVDASNKRLLHEEFDRIRGRQHFTIRLGCSLGVIGTMGPEYFDGFAQVNPNIEVLHWETNDALCEEGLLNGHYDLALIVGPWSSKLAVTELYRCPMYYWVPTSDSLASKDYLTIWDLAGHDIAIPGGGFRCLETLRKNAQATGVELGEIYEMSEIFQDHEFAATGRGLGFTVRHIVGLKTFSNSPDVVALPMRGPLWRFGITRLSTRALGKAEQKLWDWTVSYARRLPSDPLN